MDLNYLANSILPIRKKELDQGKNNATAQPIYVVLSLQENYCSGHDEFGNSTNLKGIMPEHGYLDMYVDPEDRGFSKSKKHMKTPERVTKFYTDRVVAFFLTNKGAHDYLKYQGHNMNKPYVYVFHSGYRNHEMDNLLKGQ